MKTAFCSLIAAAGTVSLAIAPASAGAATLSTVPMQGSMLMPAVSYHASAGAVTLAMPGEVPQLTPLLVSNPNDRFDAADPWFECLDPSRQGLAFSRRYGFNMDTGSDPLPAGTAIWIRKVSGPPELGFYRYRSTAPKAWEPIFGTAASTNAMQWNQMMFHPGVAAPPGTNSYSAVFELFLLDLASGEPVGGSSTGPVEFHWTTIPDGRPTLTIGPKIAIGWPGGTATNWVLEAADCLPGSEWTMVTNTPVLLDGRPAVVLDPCDAQRVFRLRLMP